MRFCREDEEYFQFRDTLKDREFGVADLDHSSLFVGVHNFARRKFLVDQLEETLDVTGNIYEFGTWRGATLVLLASWYRLRRPQGHKTLFGFDTFAGLGEGTREDGAAHGAHEGEYKGSEKDLLNVLRGKGLDSLVTLVKGDVSTTISPHFESIALPQVSFALLDMDLYEPTRNAIERLLPNLSPGGKIIFDEGTAPQWEGEQRALGYLVQKSEEMGLRFSLQENPYTRQPTTVFTRIF